jgi:uncharacterized protein DUF222
MFEAASGEAEVGDRPAANLDALVSDTAGDSEKVESEPSLEHAEALAWERAEQAWEQEQAFAFAKVEQIKDVSAQIARLEAERLVAIEQLYSNVCMDPLPPRQGRSGQPLKGLTRHDLTRSELAACLFLRDHELDRLIRTAVSLPRRLPHTLAALSEGRLDLARAQLIQEITDPLADDHADLARLEGQSPAVAEKAAANAAGQVEDWVLKRAATQKPDNLRECLHRAVNRIDPDYADRHAKSNLKARQVTHRTNRGQGTGDIFAHLGAAEALAIYAVIDAYARAARQQGSPRTLDELRADALTHLVVEGHLPDSTTPINIQAATLVPGYDPDTGEIIFTPDATPTPQGEGRHTETPDAAIPTTKTPDTKTPDTEGSDTTRSDTRAPNTETPDTTSSTSSDHAPTCIGGCSGRAPTRSGLRTHVQVTVSLETLLGMTEDPGELAGHGPITAATARDLAFNAGSTWRRLVTDPLSGQLLDYARTTYRPPVGLADFVRARDVTCRTPNCTRPADKCHLDHVIAWPVGTTSEPNLNTRCDRDHRLKHEGRWRHLLSDDPDHPAGTVIMISPAGHVYLSHPYTYLVPQFKVTPTQPDPSGSEPKAPTATIHSGPPPF